MKTRINIYGQAVFFVLLGSMGMMMFVACETVKPLEESNNNQTVKHKPKNFIAYTQNLPNTKVNFQMLPIPGGTFLMGSPIGEKGREEDEGPQVKVKIEPFWMMKTEVTWAMYMEYTTMYQILRERPNKRETTIEDLFDADVVTIPTPQYDLNWDKELGRDEYNPAVTMTPFAAKQFCKWLSLTTGHFYRLPTEAEWEYACRAGSTTAYHWGDDPTKIDEYAWYFDNSELGKDEYGYHRVATKKPNAWGLHDMHGNVMEYVIDQYHERHYTNFKRDMLYDWEKVVRWPLSTDKIVVRGGGWDSDAVDCRSASRWKSDDREWNIQDPSLPTSPWWYCDSKFVGFRVVRPLIEPTKKEKALFWNTTDKELIHKLKVKLYRQESIRAEIQPKK